LLEKPEDGQIKLFLVVQALKVRNQFKSVFLSGEYLPLEATGKFKDHIIAFARKDGDQMVVTIAPRFFTRIVQPDQLPLGEIWGDTAIELPASGWKDAIAETEHTGNTIALKDVLKNFPVALLTH
ncbi:malto-oligosyltrehalose synthase, partial [Pseudanabaenaceae cyanobacterium LEGE 13415]|nr:malto-oligosyltrehalose synthase [Pseudanabaenaceae cyanobacterium LEGE 13415]